MDFGDYIAISRKRIGLSQGKLASLAGVSQGSISDIEKGTRDISLKTFISICNALSVAPSKALAEITNDSTEGDFSASPSYQFRINNLSLNEVSLLNSLVSLFPSQQKQDTTSKGWVHGVAAAGNPVYFVDYNEEDAITINPKYVDNERFTIIRVKGDSMDPVIKNGDHVIVQRFTPPYKGDMCLAHLNTSNGEEEYVIKKYYPSKDSISLVSINEAYSPLIISPNDILSIEKVVDVIKGV